MASPALLDFSALVLPVPGDNGPAGRPVPLTVRQKLDLARKETEPHPDDPNLGEIAKKADWSGIIRSGQDLLTASSKDLLLAARMTEALTRLYGFAGLRDGLHLLCELSEKCWDHLHPAPEEGEGMEVRAGPFHWLSDTDKGARFPTTIRGVPLVRIGDTPLSLLDWKRAQEGQGGLTRADCDRAVPLSPEATEDVVQAQEELNRLDQLLAQGDRMGAEAPGLHGLREALDECRQLIDYVLRHMAPAPPLPGEAPPTGDGRPGPGGSLAAVASREEAYRQLAQIASVLEQLEPHSPIPDLLRRAVELGRMPFRQLVRELVRDPSQLAELRREFGIREAGADGSAPEAAPAS
ncbi:MAG: type VI secretion system protein TssA [Gemmataceae bacterium]|nr:type VI secretion system protein TssA [Gemmataceae bacterium]